MVQLTGICQEQPAHGFPHIIGDFIHLIGIETKVRHFQLGHAPLIHFGVGSSVCRDAHQRQRRIGNRISISRVIPAYRLFPLVFIINQRGLIV